MYLACHFMIGEEHCAALQNNMSQITTLVQKIAFADLEIKREVSHIYSRALHSADFGDKKNQCISKTVYCELLSRDIEKPCIDEFLHPLYTMKSVYIDFFSTN